MNILIQNPLQMTVISWKIPFSPLFRRYSFWRMMWHQEQTAFENIVGKEEIACNEQFLLSHNVFSSIR